MSRLTSSDGAAVNPIFGAERSVGEFRYWAGECAVGPVFAGTVEIIRRIFVAVRDANWREVPPTEWRCEPHDDDSGLDLQARHRTAGIDFVWRGVFRIDAAVRRLRFAFKGEALRDLDICRLGLVVLHPVERVIGETLTAVGPEGTESLNVASDIYPQAISNKLPLAMIKPFHELRMGLNGYGGFVLRFSGDLFEFEDQRNWAESTFKSYCTPLGLGYPRRIQADATIAHSVEIELRPNQARGGPPKRKGNEIRTAPANSALAFPSVGCAADATVVLASQGSLGR
jgi:hypothetical protein